MSDLAIDLGIALDPARLLRAIGLQADSFQEEICRDERDTLVLVSRQGGKSTAGGCSAAHRAVYKPGSMIVIVAPVQRQSVEVLRKAEQFLRATGHVPTSCSETKIELANGSRLMALPSEPDNIRGYAAHLVLIDEAARISDELYTALQPMLAVTRGRIIALTTPDGPNGWFYRAWMDGSTDWNRIRRPASECTRIYPDVLARARRSMTAAAYAAEYDCEFTDPVDAIFYSQHVDAALDNSLTPLFTGGW
jgi:hypothetical protein